MINYPMYAYNSPPYYGLGIISKFTLGATFIWIDGGKQATFYPNFMTMKSEFK